MSVVAKFQCTSKDVGEFSTQIVMSPVYHENDPEHPNYHFWEATPTGTLQMGITNISAGDYFEQGKVYSLTFEADPDPVVHEPAATAEPATGEATGEVREEVKPNPDGSTEFSGDHPATVSGAT